MRSTSTSSLPDEFCQLGVLGGYCYLNASLIRLFGERAPGLSWQTMDEQFFGVQPGIPAYDRTAGRRATRPDGEDRRDVRVGVRPAATLTISTDSPITAPRPRRCAPRRPDLTTLSERQLWERFERPAARAP